MRLNPYDTPLNQWYLMQNYDYDHSETYRQIQGSVKYHGTSLGTNPPHQIFAYYNNELDVARILVAVDDKILVRNEGTNEFTALITNLTPNKTGFSCLVDTNMFIAHPDGLLQYDGNTITKVKNGPSVKDIIFSKETNRAFAISADVENQVIWTDDIVTTGGVPIEWNALNVAEMPPTDGDVIEKLGFLNGRLVYFMTNSTWIQYVNGPAQNWRFEKSPTVVGWIAPKTIKQVGTDFWGLGFSPALGRGLYSFNGQTSSLLSFDVEPFLDRINNNLIHEACAEHVNNIYKISFAVDSSPKNNFTFHVDTIIKNEQTGYPNFYGPHTYGFSASAVLNTRIFRGQHIFGDTYQSGSWVFRVGDFLTQHAADTSDNGDLIPTVLVSGLIRNTEYKGAKFGDEWMKRFRDFFFKYPPSNSNALTVQFLRSHLNEIYDSEQLYLDDGSESLSAVNLGYTPINLSRYGVTKMIKNILSPGIQIVISNYTPKTYSELNEISFEAVPVRMIKGAQSVSLN